MLRELIFSLYQKLIYKVPDDAKLTKSWRLKDRIKVC